MRSKPIVWLVVGLLTTAALPMGAAVDQRTLVVEADEERVATSPLVVDELVVEGTLTAPASEPLVVHAEEVIVRDGGTIETPHGVRGETAAGLLAVAPPGSTAESIVLDTTSLTVESNGLVMAGSGGAGGVAISTLAGQGGAGGNGGDVTVTAEQLDVQGRVLPGAGGDGGPAVVAREGPAPHHPDVEGDGWAIGGNGGASGLFTVNSNLQEVDEDNRPSPQVTASNCSSPLPGNVNIDIQCPGGADVAILDPALPGGSGGLKTDCTTPHGEDGENNLAGDGGDGGDACIHVIGEDGEDGEDGSSGTLDCQPGGNGGHGASAQAGSASGGNGGTGTMNGGDGGDAKAKGEGGSGGAGGAGGTAAIGDDCKGGDGGNGGNGTGGTANGGNGGNGLCGEGGSNGQATAGGEGGAGGKGGQGEPSGQSGVPGQGTDGNAQGGQGGQGADVCPNDLTDTAQ